MSIVKGGTWGQALHHLQIPCPQFVGRESELLWLQERLARARQRQGELVFLAGEAGVGKSRLLAELMIRGQEAEIRVLYGACSLFETALPYAPFVEAFRGLIHGRAPSEITAMLGSYAPEVARLLPELANRVPQLRANPPLSPAAEKSRLFESLYQVLHQFADEAPMVLILEDIHWADPATLELLHFIARRLGRDRWLILAAYRPEELPRAERLSQLRQDLLRGRLAQELAVIPLNATETRELLSGVLSDTAKASEAFIAWIFQYGDGNPFFTEEILRAIVEATDEPMVTLDPAMLSAAAVPATVRTTILARLEHITAEARHILATAAVLGRTFDMGTLQEASGLAGDAFSGPFMSLLSMQLVRADRVPLRYSFRHHIIREVVSQHLAPDVRRRLHQQVGELLEKHRSPTVTPQMLVHHFQEAGDHERVVRYASTAAAAASAVYSHEEAAGYLTLALAALPAAQPERRLKVAEALGDAWWYARRYDTALDAFITMCECARALNTPLDTARAYRKIGMAEHQRLCGSGVAAWEKALAILTGLDAPGEEAAIRALTSEAAFLTGRFSHGEAEARAGAAVAVRSGERGMLGRCYHKLALNLRSLGRHREARDYMNQAVELAHEAGNLEGEAAARKDAAGWMVVAGEFGSARVVLERTHALAEKIGGSACFELTALALARLSRLEGKWDEAEARGAKALARLEEWQRPFPFGIAACYLAHVYLLRGRFDEAEALLHEAHSWADVSSCFQTLWQAPTLLAQLEMRRGKVSQAKACLDECLENMKNAGYTGGLRTEALVVLTECCVQTGDTAAAQISLRNAVEAASAFPYLAQQVCRIRGQVAALSGRLEEALEHFEAGLGTNSAAPQPYEEALLRHDLALCLLRRKRVGDHKAARSHLNTALAIAERLGARPDADMIRQALGRIRGRVPAGHTLTAREREVLALLAEGMSNAAIARRLYLSERTVEVHVSHILSKLALESRSQAAAWVAQRLGAPAAPPLP